MSGTLGGKVTGSDVEGPVTVLEGTGAAPCDVAMCGATPYRVLHRVAVLMISLGIRLGIPLISIYPGKDRSGNHSRVSHNKQRQSTKNQQPVLLYSKSSP